MSTDVLERPDVGEPAATDEDCVAHYASKSKITESYVMGTPIVALCGVVFVATKNPDHCTVCPECEEILERMRAGRN